MTEEEKAALIRLTRRVEELEAVFATIAAVVVGSPTMSEVVVDLFGEIEDGDGDEDAPTDV